MVGKAEGAAYLVTALISPGLRPCTLVAQGARVVQWHLCGSRQGAPEVGLSPALGIVPCCSSTALLSSFAVGLMYCVDVGVRCVVCMCVCMLCAPAMVCVV